MSALKLESWTSLVLSVCMYMYGRWRCLRERKRSFNRCMNDKPEEVKELPLTSR